MLTRLAPSISLNKMDFMTSTHATVGGTYVLIAYYALY